MNIYESQPELENNKTKTKKLMIIIGVAIVILFVLSIGLIFYISYIEKNKFNRINDNVKYIDNLNVNIDFYIILKLFIVIITLTIISNIITIVLINKYEPNTLSKKSKII